MYSGPIEDIHSGVGPAASPLGRNTDTLATARLMLLSRVPGVRLTDAGDFATPSGMVARDEQLYSMSDARQRRVFVQRLFSR